jgi:peptide/nickel transport system substrate-binding protein
MADTYARNRFGHRLTRRGVLKGLGGAGLLAAGAACAAPVAQTPPSTAAPAAPTAPAASAPTTAAAPAVTPSPQAKRGGVLRNANSTNWAHLDPHQSNATGLTGYAIGVAYGRLLKLKLKDVQLPAFIPTGDAAESWEQPDDLTYIFKLRPNAKWQNVAPVNGRALTAEDVTYSYDRQRTPGFPNASVLDAIAKAEATDKSTVKITLKQPSADFLLSLASPYSVIVAREVVDLKGDLKEGPMIGTGPFIADKIDPQGTSVFRRNLDYFLPGQPYLDGYQFILVPDMETQKAAFRSGSIEYVPPGSVQPGDVDLYKRSIPNLIVQNVKALGSGAEIGFKMDRPPFNDLRVRQAVLKALDRDAIAQTVWGGGWQSVGLVLPSIEWAMPEADLKRLYQRDLDGARQLLKAAGFENGLDFNLTVAGPGVFTTAAELLVAQWKEANVRATLKVFDTATYTSQVHQKGDFEAYFGIFIPFSSLDSNLLSKYHSKGSINVTKINDPKLDQMIERQSTLGRNPDERKKVALDIQRQIAEQVYVQFLLTYDSPVVLQPYVRDYFAGYGAINFEVERLVQVWLDK